MWWISCTQDISFCSAVYLALKKTQFVRQAAARRRLVGNEIPVLFVTGTFCWCFSSLDWCVSEWFSWNYCAVKYPSSGEFGNLLLLNWLRTSLGKTVKKSSLFLLFLLTQQSDSCLFRTLSLIRWLVWGYYSVFHISDNASIIFHSAHTLWLCVWGRGNARMLLHSILHTCVLNMTKINRRLIW